MAGSFKQLVVYTKVTLIVAILLGVAVVVFKNSGYKTRFWPYADQADVPTLWLMLATSVVSVCVFWLLSKMRRVWRELAELRAEKLEKERLSQEEHRRSQLNDQERRIDEKIKKALDPEKSQP
jgi:CBS domain containing-hemolysin-like protein